MTMGRVPWLSVAVATFLSAAAARAAVAQNDGGAGAGEPRAHQDAPETVDVALPEELRDALAEIAVLREEGALDAARERLRAVVAGDLYAALLRDEPDVALRGLGALDEEAGSLSLPEIQARVREETVARQSARLPAEDPELLRAKSNLAATRSDLGDFEGALALEEEVLAANERLLPADHPDLLRAQANLAVTRYALGDLEGSMALLEEVLVAWKRVLPAEQADLLILEANLAAIHHTLGDLEGALVLEEEVLAAREQALPSDHPDLLLAKANLAATRHSLGDLEGALALKEEVLAAREQALPSNHPALLLAKANLAVTRRQLGDIEGALALDEEVLVARERLLESDDPDLLLAKANLAVARRGMGDIEGALVLEEEVLAARERLLASDHPDLLRAKANLAATRRVLGDLEGALVLEEEVLAARAQTLPPDHPDLVRAKANLAVTRGDLGDLEEALTLEEEVLAARERLLAPDHPDLLRAKANLASTRHELGDLERALVLEKEVLAARERLLTPDHADLLRAKANLASTYHELGDFEAAGEMTHSLLEGQRIRATSLRTESSRVARAAALVELGRLSTALSSSGSARAFPGQRLDREAFVVLENLRVVSTGDPEVALAALRDPELEGLRQRLDRARYRLNALALSAPESVAAVEDWRVALAERAEDRDRIERELRSRLAEKGVMAAPVSIESVAGGLEEGAALVSYFRYRRRFGEDSQSGEAPRPVDSLLAFVLTPDGNVQRIELGPAEPLESLARAWLDPKERVVESEQGRVLREKLLDPCLVAIGEELPPSVHVVLDDFLHLVPLEALPWKDGRRTGEVLNVRREVSVQRLAASAREALRGGTLVAFGGVDSDAMDVEASDALVAQATTREATGRKGLPGGLAPLLHSGPEVRAVAELYRERGGPEPVVRTGGAASKEALVELAPRARYLHLATHGWFAEESLESTRDALEQQAGLRASLLEAQQTLRGFAPETLCGVALAGANRGVDGTGEAPGILTAEELRTLDLSGCDLAVLSACETNVGIRRAGQGIQSLQAALHVAGVRTSITSLWKVDDEATRLLMTDFYRRLWGGGKGKAAALWEAKQWLRSVTNDELAARAEGTPVREASSRSGDPLRPGGGPRPVGAERPFAEPFYWAGFVLTGNPD